MKKRSIRGILFDFDGTLLNSLPGWLIVIDYELRRLEKLHILSKPFPSTHKSIMEELSTDLTIVEEYGVSYESALNFRDSVLSKSLLKLKSAPLQEGVNDTIFHLHKLGIMLGIVSSTRTEIIIAHLERHKIKKYFKSIVGRDRVKHNKPNSEPVLLALSELRLPADRTIMIGDHKSDIIAAEKAGVKGILYAPFSHSEFYEMDKINKKVLVIRSIKEILTYL